ncbi:PTS sugar transporter subunit IIA [Streptobacillus felis]|uniref:PTS sugar transporter subunit IIA n=1 Tax=Streptobacillus felis TaxID=1384509 RepID=A0A7Z0PFI4_9FUSO|nr:PTS sugar transporter subunit IIA [Streptobacillus felis]NYV27841.1 PTS sugar transporter subunit IIA [Streptobacillus felis]
MIGDRNFRILELLKYGKNNIVEIAENLEISERMLRYDIEVLNQVFKYYTSTEIIEIKNANLTLLLNNYEEKLSLIPFKEYVFNSFERQAYITLDIFLENNKFKLQELSYKYDISKTTLRNVIKDINLEIDKYNLKIDVDSNKGYMIYGRESKIRFYLINKLRSLKNSKFNIYFFNNLREKLLKYSKTIDLESAKEIVRNFSEDIKLTDEAFDIISYYLYISENRNIGKNKLIDSEIDNKSFIQKTEEFKKISKYFKNKNLYELDMMMLTDLYLGLYNYNEEKSFYINWIEMEDIVNDIIKKLNENFEKDFSKDKIFREELLHHIKPAIYRMKKKITLGESISEEVIKEYGDIYNKTEKSLGLRWDKDEISFVTMMVKRALDRIEKSTNKELIKILVVCGLGYSSSKLIVENLEENFEVDIIDVIPYNQLNSYEKIDEVDLIVTTLDILSERNEIIKVNAIFKSEDVEKLAKYGLPRRNIKISESKLLEFIKLNQGNNEELIKENIRKTFGPWIYMDIEEKKVKRIYDFLTPENIKLNVEVDNIEEALKVAVELMVKNSIVEKNYYNNLKKQIDKYGKYIQIGDMTILPHGELNKDVKKTGFVLITLKNSVNFYNEEIRIIIVLASRDKDEHLDAILDINKCLRKFGFEDEIIKIKENKEIPTFLKSMLEGEK